MKKNDKVHKLEQIFKLSLSIMSKPHAHFQTMNKTSAKFQKDFIKTVREVVLTKYPLIMSDMLKMINSQVDFLLFDLMHIIIPSSNLLQICKKIKLLHS